MFGLYRSGRALLCLNLNPITTTLSSLLLQPSPLSFPLSYSTSPSTQHSFTFNYLINTCGFSPQTASKISNQVHLDNSDRPDSVLALFRSHGFSNAQISGIIHTCPKLLVFNPNKVILPKLNFFISKGASSSDLVKIVTKNPSVLYQSLVKTMIPCFDLVKKFLLSDELAMLSIKFCACLIYSKNPAHNITVLLENGVPESQVAFLLRNRYYPLLAHPARFKEAVEEVKGLGFKPETSVFIVALYAKLIKKPSWERKIDLYKKWGWPEEMIGSAFVRCPWCMLASEKKIEAVMEFWVNHMGWDSLVLAKHPILVSMSLEKRIIPRAFVMQFLQSRGLIKDATLPRAFKVTEKMFLQRFVNPFEKEASQLLKLYEEKRDLSR